MELKTDYETMIRTNLSEYLGRKGEVDERLPEAPDIEALWGKIGESYLPDAIREFNTYPTVALGWVMYVGMAVAKFWDEDWERYQKEEDLYTTLRDKSGFDHLDDYVRGEVLRLDDAGAEKLQAVVREASARVYGLMCRLNLEPGTESAFRAFVAALHQMYLMGAAMQLRRMGYHMTQLGGGHD